MSHAIDFKKMSSIKYRTKINIVEIEKNYIFCFVETSDQKNVVILRLKKQTSM